MSKTDKTVPRELGLPPGAMDDPDAAEILRAWVASNGLKISFLKVWDEPDNWGIFLADLARHAARVYGSEATMTEAEALGRIRRMFEAEWNKPTDLGSTRPVVKQ